MKEVNVMNHAAMNNAVVCTGVEKSFGQGETRTQVLRQLDLSIEMGGLAMLVGPSGCGKTTLISVITGLLDLTAGTVEVPWASSIRTYNHLCPNHLLYWSVI